MVKDRKHKKSRSRERSIPKSQFSDIEQRILEYVKQPGYKAKKAKGLAKKLEINKKELPNFRAVLDSLVSAGSIKEGRNDLIRPRAAAGSVEGIIKLISSGAGFLIPHSPRSEGQSLPNDVFISANDLHGARTGDEVLAVLTNRRRRGGQRCGRVTEIIDRATTTFVGTYFERDARGFVDIDGKDFQSSIFVGDPGAKGAQPNDKVVIEMLRFPTPYQTGEAVVTSVLGPRGEPGVDNLTIIHEFGLPLEFPDEVMEEARIQAEQFDEADLGDRLDLTKETIVTIDPADARDFDDAISLSRSDDGQWRLGVHIADVSHFVEPDGALDREAIKRGNSVYLPCQVIPMLPELISNGLASLQQGRVRYVKSAFIDFTADGSPLNVEFANAAIKVTRRFAYEEVMPIIQNSETAKRRVSAKVKRLLCDMCELAMLLRRRRFGKGSLDMDIPEIQLEFDKQGRVSGAHESEHDESHQIIEEFMLAANFAVAADFKAREIPFIRRTHDSPNPMKLQSFAEFVRALGYKLKKPQSRTAQQKLLNQVKDTPHERAVNYSLLRSMKQAEYTGQEIGHYALAADDYCHFTSPIRRYPDLTVHRLIDSLLTRKKVRAPNIGQCTRIGKQCSSTERRAASAERELTKLKLLTYMESRIGDELDAIITGVERFGFFCQGTEIPVEGLVHISALNGNDNYYFDATTFSLIGRRTGQQFQLGNQVRVKVVHVDVDRRKLDFRPMSGPTRLSAPTAKKTRTPVTSTRKSPKKTKRATTRSGKKQRAASKKRAKKTKATRRKKVRGAKRPKKKK